MESRYEFGSPRIVAHPSNPSSVRMRRDTDGMRRPVSETGCDKLPKMRVRRGKGDRL